MPLAAAFPRETSPDRDGSYASPFEHQIAELVVDSTYYALPAERNAKLWAERTADGFVFNINRSH